jgi:hypothetical protein
MHWLGLAQDHMEQRKFANAGIFTPSCPRCEKCKRPLFVYSLLARELKPALPRRTSNIMKGVKARKIRKSHHTASCNKNLDTARKRCELLLHASRVLTSCAHVLAECASENMTKLEHAGTRPAGSSRNRHRARTFAYVYHSFFFSLYRHLEAQAHSDANLLLLLL